MRLRTSVASQCLVLLIVLFLSNSPPSNAVSAELKANTSVGYGEVSGRVLDAQGQVVAGATVVAHYGREFEKKAKTHNDGRFAFARLPAGRYHLKAEKGQAYTLRLPEYDVRIEDGSKKNVDLTLAPGGAFEWTVVDARTKKAIKGAEIIVEDPREARRVTDAKGKARIEGLGYERVDYFVHADGYARAVHPSYNDAEPNATTKETVALDPEEVITGVVVDKEGAPVPDAVVTIRYRWQDRWGQSGDWDPAITDAKGAFQIGGLEPGEYSYGLVVTKEGFAPASAQAYHGKSKEARIVLRSGATVEGVVRDAKGKPVARAMVHLGDGHSIRSDQQGRFKFTKIEADKHEIFAEKGDARSEEIIKNVRWSDKIKGLEITLREKKDWTYNISGTILDDIKGTPLAGVPVRFWSPSGFDTKTDASGRFTLSAVPAGNYKLYLPTKKLPAPFIKPMQDQEIKVVDRDIQGLVVRLKRGATVSGRVLLPSGEGAWEAHPRLIHPNFSMAGYFSRKLRADTNGRFEVKGVHPAMGIRVRADLEGYAPAMSQEFHIRQGDTVDDIVIQLKRPGSISGTVQDAQGNPIIKNVRIRVSFRDVSDRADYISVGEGSKIDEQGRYKVSNLPSGTFRVSLSVTDPRGWSRTEKRKIVEVKSGEETAGVNFVSADAGPTHTGNPEKTLPGFIAGQVLSVASDEGLGGIEIDARATEYGGEKGGYGKTKTKSDGSFRIEGLVEGTFTVTANRALGQGHDSQEIEKIPVDSEDIPLILKRLCAIEGRIVLKATGKPVKRFFISDVGSKEEEVANAEGRFTLDGLRRGEVTLRARAPGVGVVQRTIELKEGQTIRDVTLELHAPWTIKGRVVRKKDGKPLAGATVVANTFKRDPKKNVLSDADGRFVLAGLYPGKETLFIDHPEFGKPWFPDIEIREDSLSREVVFELEEPARVQGRVAHESGLPYDGVELRLAEGKLEYSSLYHEKTQSHYDGDYAFPVVPPGKYNMIWNVKDPEIGRGGLYAQRVELKPGQTATIDFGWAKTTIEGKVTDRGQPKLYAVVTFTKGAVQRRVQADGEGNYFVYGIAPGRWRVTLTMPGQRDTLLDDRSIDLVEKVPLRLDFQMPQE